MRGGEVSGILGAITSWPISDNITQTSPRRGEGKPHVSLHAEIMHSAAADY